MSDHNLPEVTNANQGADQGAQPTQAPQPPTPVPSLRLSTHTVTPPIPARPLRSQLLIQVQRNNLTNFD